jgi:hypothetical protein
VNRSHRADKALIVTIHHPPLSGDTEHSRSTVAEKVLFESFVATGKYPHLILSGHVHNYQRFTVQESVKSKTIEIPCVVAGAGGYSKLGTLHKIKGKAPMAPLQLSDTLRLECCDDQYFGFMRLEVTKGEIAGTYYSAPYQEGETPKPRSRTASRSTSRHGRFGKSSPELRGGGVSARPALNLSCASAGLG